MPYVKWTMGQVDLTKEEEMPLGRNVLEVTNIHESANYTCVAISSLGMIDHTAQVTVKGERRLFTLVYTFTFTCEVVAFNCQVELFQTYIFTS